MTIYRRLMATAALTTGILIGLAVNANAAPVSDDFWECAAEHPDDIGVCCVFYGGDYDERTGVCYIEESTSAPDGGQTRPPVKPRLPGLTPVTRAPVATLG
jgi:hypothetical protein